MNVLILNFPGIYTQICSLCTLVLSEVSSGSCVLNVRFAVFCHIKMALDLQWYYSSEETVERWCSVFMCVLCILIHFFREKWCMEYTIHRNIVHIYKPFLKHCINIINLVFFVFKSLAECVWFKIQQYWKTNLIQTKEPHMLLLPCYISYPRWLPGPPRCRVQTVFWAASNSQWIIHVIVLSTPAVLQHQWFPVVPVHETESIGCENTGVWSGSSSLYYEAKLHNC